MRDDTAMFLGAIQSNLAELLRHMHHRVLDHLARARPLEWVLLARYHDYQTK